MITLVPLMRRFFSSDVFFNTAKALGSLAFTLLGVNFYIFSDYAYYNQNICYGLSDLPPIIVLPPELES